MDWKLFAQLVTTFVVAIFGGWFGHYLSSRRDQMNERRKMRIAYLLEAFRRLERVALRDRLDELEQFLPDLESAVADIQLLGSPEQVLLAKRLVGKLLEERKMDLHALLAELRRTLRSELQLEQVPDNIAVLRFSKEKRP